MASVGGNPDVSRRGHKVLLVSVDPVPMTAVRSLQHAATSVPSTRG